jgi:TolB-like protein/Flp pilus assembly protein TadD
VALAAIGATIFWMARDRGGAGPSGPSVSAPPATSGTPLPVPAAADTRRKIVVLPFENLGTPEDAYFAAGVTDEISSRLAGVGGLGVISRTSALQYAKTTKTTKQIGAELGVDYVLEGTVRWEKAGGGSRVRVTPQLVRVSDETQLWGDRYDREMKDIFKVQSEIAEQVVGKLGLAVGHGSAAGSAAASPTANLEAYQAYLKGKAENVNSGDPDIQKRIVASFEEAVRLDPRFALAWAELSRAHTGMYHYRYDYSEARLEKARDCADRALALQPDLREARLALGYYYDQGRHDYAQAAEEFHRVAGDRADDPDALEAMGYVLRRQGRWEESLAALQKAYALNPRNVSLITNLVGTYQSMRRYDEALRLTDISIALSNGGVWEIFPKVFLLVEADGNTTRARQTLLTLDPKKFTERPGIESLLDYYDRRYDESLEHLEEYPHQVLEQQNVYRPKALLAGLTYRVMQDPRAAGRCEEARRLLETRIAGSPRDARMRAAMGQALACLGRKEEALREARLAADLSPVSADAMDGPLYLENIAYVQVMNGDLAAATDLFARLFEMPGGTSPNIVRLDPIWAPLLDYPPFRKLIAKYP